MTERPRWLIIIQHQYQDLYEALRERFGELGIVVRLDRRRAERRQGTAADRGAERREADRRQRRPIAWVYPSEPSDALGPDFERLDFAAGPVSLPVATVGLVAETCPDCGVSVEFAMPQFAHPPVSVDTVVVHRTDPTFGVQHYVDVRSPAAAGQPAVIQRVQAHRRTPRHR